MSLPRYSEYKETNVDWLGKVPSHWHEAKFRHAFKESGERIESDVFGVMLSVSGYRGIEVKEYDDENRRRSDEDLIGYRIVRPGQLVVNTMWLNYAGLGVSDHEGHVSPAYRAYSISKDFDRRFIHHMMRSELFVRGYTKYLTGVRPNSLQMSREDLMQFRILKPPFEEQVSIAAFLDRETSKIDTLIAEQERLLRLLAEKRQAVISHAVTKGLNPDAPMKDSGVAWLGEVPAHWEVKQLRHFAEVLRGKFTHRPRNDPAFYDGEFPFVQTGDITGSSRYIESYRQTLNERGVSVSKEFPSGTLVMAIAANIGDVAILTFPAYFPDSIVGLLPKVGVELPFLYYLMNAMKAPMMQTATVSTQLNLNVDQISSLVAGCPSADEQVAVVEFLDAEVKKLDELVVEATHAIELLAERRSALIAAAVTGQIDVREAA
jgi:type I restriction enzyme S subunit